MTRVVAYQNKAQPFARRIDYLIISRVADIMQAILEFYLPRKKAFQAAIKDAMLALAVGMLIGLLIGIVILSI